MRLYLVRHGQSTNNANERKVPDPPLTPTGLAQAHAAGRALAAEQTPFAAIYTSPMRRALETAQALRAALHAPVTALCGLCETGGLMTHPGLSRAEILREWPDVCLDPSITETGWWTPCEIEEAEDVAFARAERMLTDLQTRHAPEDSLVVVTHGTFGNAILSTLLGLPPAGRLRFHLDNTGITRADLRQETVRIYYHNITSHVRGEG